MPKNTTHIIYSLPKQNKLRQILVLSSNEDFLGQEGRTIN